MSDISTSTQTLSTNQDSMVVESSSFDFSSLVPFFVIIVIFYFLVIRPQESSRKKHEEMIKSAKKGDLIILQGGIHGKIIKSIAEEPTVTVEISDKVEIKVERSSIMNIIESKSKS